MADCQTEKSTAIDFLAKVDPTLLAGLVFLAFGGGIISFYYSHIAYLPDIEWSHSIVHLATATLIGGGFALLLALSLFIPGCLWSAFLLRDEELKEAFCFKNNPGEICVRTLLLTIGLPFAAVIVVNHAVLLLVEKESAKYLLSMYGIACAILLTLAGWRVKRNLDELLKDKNKNLGEDKDQRYFKYIAWFLISIVVSQVSMLLIYLFSGKPTGWAFWITTIFCTLGVIISNHFVAIHYEKSRVQSVLVSLVIAALLLFIADRNANLSVQVLAFFGLGEKSASVDLLLTNEGAEASEKLNMHQRCAVPSRERLCDVQVLSRLGNEYLLKAGDQIFTLPKTAVISRTSRR